MHPLLHKAMKADAGVFNDVPFEICPYCSRKIPRKRFTKDHITPRSQGGRGSNNFTTCCYECNQAKANLPLLTFLAHRPKSSKEAQELARPKKPTRQNEWNTPWVPPKVLEGRDLSRLVLSPQTRRQLKENEKNMRV